MCLLNNFYSYTVKTDIIVKIGIHNSISATFTLHLHCAATLRHCIHSYTQQSQWLIPSSICYCMAEGNCAEHTCPATCLHHRARAGRDSECECLQWSDYAPVFKHVQCHSVRLLPSAAVCGKGIGENFWLKFHLFFFSR